MVFRCTPLRGEVFFYFDWASDCVVRLLCDWLTETLAPIQLAGCDSNCRLACILPTAGENYFRELQVLLCAFPNWFYRFVISNAAFTRIVRKCSSYVFYSFNWCFWICFQPIPTLRRQQNRVITMSQEQAACLLANAFYCTFPFRLDTRHYSHDYRDFPDINFNR